MVDKRAQPTRYHCKACNIWIADNKAQRDQHERGSRHKTASEAMLRDIARRNKEKALQEAETRTQVLGIEAKALAAVGKTSQQECEKSLQDRAFLLENIAKATTTQQASVQFNANEGRLPAVGVLNGSVQPVHDSRGYGEWEEVPYIENNVSRGFDEACPDKKNLLGNVRERAFDEDDEEEAERSALVHVPGTGCPLSDSCEKGEDTEKVVFKTRGSSKCKRRRKL